MKEEDAFHPKSYFLVQDVLVSQSENAKGKGRKKGLPKTYQRPTKE